MKRLLTCLVFLYLHLQNVSAQSPCLTNFLTEPFNTATIAGANAAVIYGGGGSNHNSSYLLSGSYFGWFNIVNGVSNVDVYDVSITGLQVGCSVSASIMIRESFGGTNVDLSLVDDNGMVMSTVNLNLTSSYQNITLTAPITTTGLNYIIHFNGTGGGGLDIATENLVINQTCTTTADIVPLADQCLNGNSFFFDGSNSTADLGITSYSWDFDDGSLPATNPTETHSYTNAGIYAVILTVSDGACSSSLTYTINVIEDSDASITQAGPFCTGDPSVTLVGADPGGTWSGTGITNPVTGAFDPTLAGTGSHTITYDIPGMCGDVQTSTIVVNNANDATITPIPNTICAADAPFNLSAVSSGGTWSGNGISDPILGTFDPALAGAGTHTITYDIPAPCPDVQTTTITVIAFWDITITPFGPFCENAPTLSLAVVTAGGTWSGNGISDPILGTFDPTIAGPGLHTISYTLPGGCGSTSTEDVLINALPVMDFSADVTSGCLPLTVNFTDNSMPSGTACTWFTDGTSYSSCGSATHTFNTLGCFDVFLALTSADGCYNSQTITDMICVHPYPVADFNYGPLPVSVNNEILFENTSQNGFTYFWDFGGFATSTDINTSFTFPNDAQGSIHDICLTAISDMGCAHTACKAVNVISEFLVYVPNSFSPNNDNINDLFLPVVSGLDPDNYSLMIFNRWGEKIFETSDPLTGWDGTYKGQSVQDDVYIWKIETSRDNDYGSEKFTGHVTLFK